jgi:hypothetical protein
MERKMKKKTKRISLCDISKILISLNNGIPNYRYRDIDSCLITGYFVRPLVGQIISWKSRQKRLKSRAFSRFFAEHKSYNIQKKSE